MPDFNSQSTGFDAAGASDFIDPASDDAIGATVEHSVGRGMRYNYDGSDLRVESTDDHSRSSQAHRSSTLPSTSRPRRGMRDANADANYHDMVAEVLVSRIADRIQASDLVTPSTHHTSRPRRGTEDPFDGSIREMIDAGWFARSEAFRTANLTISYTDIYGGTYEFRPDPPSPYLEHDCPERYAQSPNAYERHVRRRNASSRR